MVNQFLKEKDASEFWRQRKGQFSSRDKVSRVLGSFYLAFEFFKKRSSLAVTSSSFTSALRKRLESQKGALVVITRFG